MTPLPHQYDVTLAAGPTGYARVSSEGLPVLPVAAPTDFDGPGDAWSPEHMLLASVQACFLLTMRAIAGPSQLTFISLESSVSGTVDKKDGALRFTEIVIRPRLRVPAGTDRERAMKVMEKSEKACLISASLSTPIRLEPEVIEG
jgi:peroxiredoxin-like protein